MPTPDDAPYKLAQQNKRGPRRALPIPRASGHATTEEQVRAERLRDVLVEWAASKRPKVAEGEEQPTWWPELAPLTFKERALVREYLAALDAGEAA